VALLLNPGHGGAANARFEERLCKDVGGWLPYVVAARDVPAGSEVLFDYQAGADGPAECPDPRRNQPCGCHAGAPLAQLQGS
jgi:hypothetical protein